MMEESHLKNATCAWF